MKQLTNALSFAAQKHSWQRRKDEAETPYINHLFDVLRTLVHNGRIKDETLLKPGVRHDTVEDTKTTEEELRSRFGEEVTSSVLEVTNDKSLRKIERKRLQIEPLPKNRQAPEPSNWPIRFPISEDPS